MIDVTRIQRGALDDNPTWCQLYWVEDRREFSLAIRQKTNEKTWYVTKDYMPNEIIVHGPYPSKEAIEMLMVIGEIDLPD